MRIKTPFIILLFLVLLLVYGVYLLLIVKRSKDDLVSNLVPTTSKDTPSGDLIVGKIEKHPVVPFERVDLDSIWIKNSTNRIGDDGQTPLIDLELAFRKNGVENNFTVTLIGEVFYGIYGKKNEKSAFENKGSTDIQSLDLIKGEFLSLVVAYIPAGSGDVKNKMLEFCKIEADPVCNYLPLGFGTEPIDLRGSDTNILGGGRKFLPSEIAVWSLTRDLVSPNAYK